MYNITVIATRHKELGLCTPNALCHILEELTPEVIFEEKPPSCFDEYYVQNTRSGLESKAILEFAEKINFTYVPVDADNIPPDSFFSSLQLAYEEVEKLTDINGRNFRMLTDTIRRNTQLIGFTFLNSFECLQMYDGIDLAIENGLQVTMKEQLTDVYHQWKDINEKRENEMIQNIYSYSKEHPYNKAVFLVGAAHMKSIIQKTEECIKKEAITLNWSFYNR